MKKNSINLKIFLVAALFFIIFTTVTMTSQSLLIEKFYLNKKTSDFKKNFDGLNKKVAAVNYDMDLSANDIVDFDIKNNTRTELITNLNYYQQLIQSGQTINNNPEITSNARGNLPGGQFVSIRSAFFQWFNSPELLKTVVDSKKSVVFQSNSGNRSTKSIIGVMPVISKGEADSVLITLSSLQPIGEAASVIKDLYVYFYIIAFFLTFMISLILSKMISRPLVDLNNVASKMSDFDFSAKYEIRSKDEIGSLGKTLNFLSEKLGNALNDLTIANNKLKEDIEKEKQLEKMRKEFVAGVSHELKTPISIINGYAEGLRDNILEDEKDFFIDVIIDESEKMSFLVNDMLDLSTLESGSYKLTLEAFSLKELIDSLYNKYTNHLKNKNIRILYEPGNDELCVIGDEFRIEQVLINLLDNAVKHTAENNNITINVKETEDTFITEIINDGKNIPEDEIAFIWDKFYKIDKSRNRDVGGTGIGLSIVKDILELHKSDYGAENLEIGVRFYFSLTKEVSKE